MNEREALKLALEALKEITVNASDYDFGPAYEGAKQRRKKAITAIREALAQPEQEQIQPDKVCIEDDGCPTEKAVLQRFWREHQKTQQQEPVAWFSTLPDGRLSIKIVGKPTEGNWEPLYTTPPQRTWIGLTNEEIDDLFEANGNETTSFFWVAFARAIEAKLKEKNT